MVRSAVVRLSLLYLAIIMAISIGFSVLLYRVASSELDRELRRPPVVDSLTWKQSVSFENFRVYRVAEGREHLQTSLIILNLGTFALGGGLSYYAARRTIKPIGDSLEAQSRFASDASHELRTPLAVMQAEIEVMLRDETVTADELRDQLCSNLEEVNKLQLLSDNLLRLARETDPCRDHHTFAIKKAVDAALDRIDKAAQKKFVSLKAEVDKSLLVHGDEMALAELFYVLLDNAVKYGPPKQPILIRGRQQQHRVVIDVVDQGPGIPQEALPHLFERFYRADSSRSKKTTAGYGLGLAIADKIVRQHKGTIKVSSTTGQGSTFSVSLPRA